MLFPESGLKNWFCEGEVNSESSAESSQSRIARSLSIAHSAGEKSGSTHARSSIEEEMLCLVCFSLNQSQSPWVAQNPQYCESVSAKYRHWEDWWKVKDLDLRKRALALKYLNPFIKICHFQHIGC